jgi:hypothetical protein
MVKFFRKIRQRLISENRLGKYLLYALGEIVLVVIGILIALQISNINEQKKERVFELKMLREIRKEIIQDTIYFNMIKRRAEITVEGAEKMKIFFAKKEPVSDSVETYSYKMFTGFIFSYHKGAYEALKSTGIDKVSNDSIRNALTDLYDFSIPRTGTLISYGLSSTFQSNPKDTEKFYEFTLKTNTHNNMEYTMGLQKNYFEKEELLFRVMDISYSYGISIMRLTDLLEDCENVLKLIDRELGIEGVLKSDPKNTWS